MNTGNQSIATWALYCALFLAAFGVRLVGLDAGTVGPDDRVDDAMRVLMGQWVPQQDGYPLLHTYLTGFALIILFLFGWMVQLWVSVTDFWQAYSDDPAPFYLAGRYLTVALGALIAPFGFNIARRVGLNGVSSLFVAATVTLLPIGMMIGRTSGADAGVATMCMAVVWALVARSQSHSVRRWDIALGVTIACAISFKQSALILIVPLALTMLLLEPRRSRSEMTVTSLGLALLVAVILYPLLNFGMVLDVDGFLAFQETQRTMPQVQADGYGPALQTTLERFGDTLFGINPVFLAVAIVAPLWLMSRSCKLMGKDVLIAVWIANTLATLALAFIAGEDQPNHLFFVQMNMFLVLAALVLMDMSRTFYGLAKGVVVAVAAFGFGISLFASVDVMRNEAPASMTRSVPTQSETEETDPSE